MGNKFTQFKKTGRTNQSNDTTQFPPSHRNSESEAEKYKFCKNERHNTSSDPTYQYEASGPLRHILPECNDHQPANHYKWQQCSYFSWQPVFFDILHDTERNNMDDLVKCYWSKTYRVPFIYNQLPVDFITNFGFEKDDFQAIFNVKWTVIKNVDRPNITTLCDIAYIMTQPTSVVLHKYDEMLLTGFMRLNCAKKHIISDILQTCLMFLSDAKNGSIPSICAKWKWTVKVKHCQCSIDYKQVQRDIRMQLIQILEKFPAKKCLFFRGILGAYCGNSEFEYDSMDIWWVLDEPTLIRDSISNCIILRFHRQLREESR